MNSRLALNDNISRFKPASQELGTEGYVLLSVAASVDGYIDDTTDQRLLLSNDADFDRVDAVRATADAILVGANTIRRTPSRTRQTRHVGDPLKVTLTSGGDLDPAAGFFTLGDVEKIVYVASSAVDKTRERLADAGKPLDLTAVLVDLASRGVGRLMVEGGSRIHTEFLTAGLVGDF